MFTTEEWGRRTRYQIEKKTKQNKKTSWTGISMLLTL